MSSPFEVSPPVPMPWIPGAPSSWPPALHPEPGPTLALKGPVLSSLGAQASRDQFPDSIPARRGTELFQPVLQALSPSLALHLSGCPPPPSHLPGHWWPQGKRSCHSACGQNTHWPLSTLYLRCVPPQKGFFCVFLFVSFLLMSSFVAVCFEATKKSQGTRLWGRFYFPLYIYFCNI